MYKLADPGRSPESKRQLQAAPWSLASYKAEEQNPEQSARSISPPPSASRESPKSHPALHRPKQHFATQQPFLEGTRPPSTWSTSWGPGAPTLGLSPAPERRSVRNRAFAPKPKLKPPILSPEFRDAGPASQRCWFLPGRSAPSRARQRDPRLSGLLQRGSCCATPSPQLTSPGGHGQGGSARPASRLQPTEKWGPRGSLEGASRVLVGSPDPQGLRHLPGWGRGVPLASREARRPRIPLASAPGAKWSGRLLPAAARARGAGGTEHSSRRAVAQPAPRFAIRPRRGGSAGFHPPRPREAPAARVSGPGTRHGAVPRPGLAAAGRRLPSRAVAGPGRGRSRRGLVPEGDRSRARSRPPAGPAAARRRPAAPAPPRRPPWGRGKGPGSPKPGRGRRGPRDARPSPAAPARFPCSPPPYWYL